MYLTISSNLSNCVIKINLSIPKATLNYCGTSGVLLVYFDVKIYSYVSYLISQPIVFPRGICKHSVKLSVILVYWTRINEIYHKQLSAFGLRNYDKERN